MSRTTTTDDEEEIVTVNFKATASFLEDIDDTWQGRGFNSRSEFIRYTLRDAVEFPSFDRDELVALLAAEDEIHEAELLGPDGVRDQLGASDS